MHCIIIIIVIIIAFSTFKLTVRMLFLLVVVLKSMIIYQVTALMPVIPQSPLRVHFFFLVFVFYHLLFNA